MNTPSEDDLETLDEYALDSFARGWDSHARQLGNRRAVRRPPIPMCADMYFRGGALARRLTALFSKEASK